MQPISSITLETSAGSPRDGSDDTGMCGLSEQLNKAISQFKVKDDFVHHVRTNCPTPSLNRGGFRGMSRAIDLVPELAHSTERTDRWHETTMVVFRVGAEELP